MKELQNGEQASYWLSARLKKLEVAIQQAAELNRLLTQGAREVLVDIEADPNHFAHDAADRVRRYSTRTRQATLEELRRQGFQLDVLERSYLELLSEDANRAVEILDAMLATLRQRIEVLGGDGTTQYERGHEAFDAGTSAIGEAIQDARGNWQKSGPGKHLRSILPWRRWRAAKLDPAEDAAFRMEIATAGQKAQGGLTTALTEIGKGTVLLSIAKYYSDFVNHLNSLLSVTKRLSDKARRCSAAAGRRVEETRRAAARRFGGEFDTMLLDDRMLDAVLKKLDINAGALLSRGHVTYTDLAELSEDEFSSTVREWVESELAHVAMPTLAEALGGMSRNKSSLTRGVRELLFKGQPLMAFNDDLTVRYEEGQRAQCYAIAQCDDLGVLRAMDDACDQLGFPNPLVEHTEAKRDALSLRVMLFAAGLPFFSQADRLKPMLKTHKRVISAVDPADAIDPDIHNALRDMSEVEELMGLIPGTLEEALLEDDDEYEEASEPEGPERAGPQLVDAKDEGEDAELDEALFSA